MATKKTATTGSDQSNARAKKAAPPAKADANGYKIVAEEWGFTKGDTDSQMMAALSTRSALTATTYKAYAGGGDKLEVTDVMGELRKAGDEVVAGNMSRVEIMLAHQALTLDAIFNNLMQRAHRQNTFNGLEVLMRLGLKAQAQSRSTAEALAEIKNPRPVSFVKQANMTTGPQQINNGSAAQSPAGNFPSEPSKLLECQNAWGGDLAPKTQKNETTEGVTYCEKAA